MHALLIHQCMYIHQTECLFTIILLNTTNLSYFTLLYATLLPFAPLCAPLHYFTLLYSTLLYLGISSGMERIGVVQFRSWCHYQLIVPCYWAFDAWLGFFVVWYERTSFNVVWDMVCGLGVFWCGLGCFNGPQIDICSMRSSAVFSVFS